MKWPKFFLKFFGVGEQSPKVDVSQKTESEMKEFVEEEIELEDRFFDEKNVNRKRRIAEELDKKRWEAETFLIQKSTKTTFPQFLKIHNRLRMKYRWYYNWHLLPYAGHVHWAALFTATAIAAVLVITANFGMPQKTMAEQKRTLAAKDTSGVYQLKPGETEVVSARTENFKKFTDGKGNNRVAGQIGAIHYKLNPFDANETYKEIDLTIDKVSGQDWNYEMANNGYQVKFWDQTNLDGKEFNYLAEYRRAGQWLKMAPVKLVYENAAGDQQLISRPKKSDEPIIDNDNYTITWKNVFGEGLDFRYNIGSTKFFKTVIVKDKNALPQPKINREGLKLTVVMAVAWDNGAETSNGFAQNIDTASLGEDLPSSPSPAAASVPSIAPSATTTPTELPSATPTVELSPSASPEAMINNVIGKAKAEESAITKVGKVDEEKNNPAEFSYKDSQNRDIWWMQQPQAWDSAEKPTYTNLDWSLDRKGNNTFMSVSMPYSEVVKSIYPLNIDTVMAEQLVSANADEYMSGSDLVWPGTSNRGYNYISAGIGQNYYWYLLGTRFAAVPLAKDVVITSASITYEDYSGDTGTGNFKIWAEAADNPATYDSTNHPYARVYSHPTASSPVTWAINSNWTSNTWYASSDISPIVQNLVSRAGWASGQAMSFAVGAASGSETLFRSIGNYYQGAGYAPKFNVTYSTVSLPTVTTQAATSVGGTTTVGNGNITDTGGENATSRGVKVSAAGAGSCTDATTFSDAGSWGAGAFTKTMTGLTASSNYWYRAFATNSAGTGYGSCQTFTTKASYTWDGGGGADTNWSTAANWVDDTAPGVGNTAVFDGTSSNSASIDAGFAPASIGGITINAGYGGTITLNNNLTVTGDFSIAAGTFNGGAGSKTLNIGGNWSRTAGTVTPDTSTVNFNAGDAGNTIAAGTQHFNKLTFNNANGSWTFSDAQNIDSDFTITAANTVTLGAFTHTISGNATLGGTTFTSTGSTVVMAGSSKNLVGANKTLNNLTITGTPITVSTSSLNIVGTLNVNDGKTFTIGASTAMNAGSTTNLNTTGTINGGENFTLMDSAGANLSTGGTLSPWGVYFRASAGDITVPARTYSGGVVVIINYNAGNYKANLGTGAGQTLAFSGNLVINSQGTGNISADASANNPTVNVTGNISFTKASTGAPSVSMGSGTWTASGNVDFTNGTVTAGTSTLIMNGSSKNLIGNGQTVKNLQISNNVLATTSDTLVDGTLTVDNTKVLTIDNGRTVECTTNGTVTINGTIGANGNGQLKMTSYSIPRLSTGGTLTATTFFNWTFNFGIEVPARTYGGPVIFDPLVQAYLHLGTGAGQTFNFQSSVTVAAKGTQHIYLNGGLYNPTVNITGDLTCTKASTGTANIVFGTGTWTFSGNVDFTNCTVDSTGSSVVMNGAGKVITGANQTLNNFRVSANTSHNTSYLYIGGTLTIDDGITLTDGTNLYLNDGSSMNLNSTGTMTGGSIVFRGNAVSNLSTGGTLNSQTVVQPLTTVNLPQRTYGGYFTFSNGSSGGNSDVTIVLGTAGGQTMTFSNTVVIATNAAGKTTVDATAYNPTVNILVGNTGASKVQFTKSTTGEPTLKMGSGVWSVGGSSVDARNGVVDAGTSTLRLVSTVANRSLYTNGNTWNNVEFALGAGSHILQDDLSTNGYFKITTGTIDATNRTLNITGDFNHAGGSITTTGSTVNLTGGDGSNQLVHGSTSFNNLAVSTASNTTGRTITFDGLSTQTVASLALTGASGKVVTLQSSTANNWTINPTAVTSSTYLSVSRSTNSGIAFCSTYSTDGNNNTNWQFTRGSACAAPAAPSDFWSNVDSPTQITWGWTNNADNDDNVRVEDAAHANISGNLAYGTATWPEPGLSANTSYTRHANAVNAYGSTDSNSDTVYTLANNPGVPTVNATSPTSLTIIIDTNSNPAATEFAISCDADATFLNYTTNACEAIADDVNHWRTYANWGGAAGFVDTGLAVNTTHTYKIRARNGNKLATVLSGGASKFTLANVPDAPTVSTISATSLKIVINANSNPANTTYAIRNDTSGNYVQADGTLGAGAVWQDRVSWGGDGGINNTGLTADNTSQNYKVKAKDGNGAETALSGGAARFTGASDPGFITATKNGSDKIDLSWLSGGAQSKFNVYRDGESGSGTQIHSANDLAFTDTGLTPSITYNYYLYAVNGDDIETTNFSTASAQTSATPASPVPTASSSPTPSSTPSESTTYSTPSVPSTVVVDEPVTLKWNLWDIDWSWLDFSWIHIPIPRLVIPQSVREFAWDLGDGTKSLANKLKHTYSRVGKYLVRLTITADNGTTSEIVKEVTVVPPAPKISSIEPSAGDLLIKGSAYPGSLVYLTISSDPFTVIAAADQKGIFSYLIKNPEQVLEPGGHKIEAIAAIKPSSKEREIRGIDTAKYDFFIDYQGQMAVVEKQTRLWQYISISLGILLLMMVIYVFFFRRKKKAKN